MVVELPDFTTMEIGDGTPRCTVGLAIYVVDDGRIRYDQGLEPAPDLAVPLWTLLVPVLS